MYLTPIFYPIEALPENVKWFVENLNPMFFYVGQFRSLVYYCELPKTQLIISGIVTALLMLAIGILSFLKTQHKFILYI